MVREIGLPFHAPLSLAGSHDDSELVQRCKGGVASAFEELYRMHGSRMKSIAFHLLGNTSDAEDAVQETFLKVYRGVHGFSGSSSIATWIFRILINTCRDVGRKRRRSPIGPGSPAEPASTRPSAPLRLALEQAFRQIQEHHRLVFLLFEVEGLTHAEIAGIMEVPVGTSKAWLFEAKRELKKRLAVKLP
jgi:RNA polymerase sigma-70 factor, ECF subfamily